LKGEKKQAHEPATPQRSKRRRKAEKAEKHPGEKILRMIRHSATTKKRSPSCFPLEKEKKRSLHTRKRKDKKRRSPCGKIRVNPEVLKMMTTLSCGRTLPAKKAQGERIPVRGTSRNRREQGGGRRKERGGSRVDQLRQGVDGIAPVGRGDIKSSTSKRS